MIELTIGSAPPARFQVLVEPDGTTGSYVLLDRVTLAPIATLVLFWVLIVKLMRDMDDDPVVFALRDPASWVTGGLASLVLSFLRPATPGIR